MKPLIIVLMSLMLVACAEPVSADIIYSFVNFPGFQNGHTITGTITTDGTIGAITGSNITNLNISWSGGPNPGGFTALWTPSTMAGVTATATDLTISGTGDMTLFAGPTFDANNRLFIQPNSNSYSATASGLTSWSSTNPTGSKTSLIFASNATSAAVPEPCSTPLLSVGAAGVLAHRKRNRRKDRLNQRIQ